MQFLFVCILLFSQIYTLRFLKSLEKSICIHSHIQFDPFWLFKSFGTGMRTKKVCHTFVCKRNRNMSLSCFNSAKYHPRDTATGQTEQPKSFFHFLS